MILPEFPASMLEESFLEQPPDVPPGTTERLRLIGCRLERQPAARSRVSVEFAGAWFDKPMVCQQEGATCPGGDLRLAARATLDALTTATRGAISFDLIGVKPSRAFDTNLMLVAVMVRHDGKSTKALGVAVDEDNTVLATVRATLHAVNRFVSPILGPLPIAD